MKFFLQTYNLLYKGQTNMEDILYTIPEVSKLIKSNANYVRELLKSGQLKGLQLGNVKVRKSELERFLKENEGKDLTDPFNIKDLEI